MLEGGNLITQLNFDLGSADSIIAYATVALVIVTIGLVAVTAYYAVQTRHTVREMKRATESQFLPFVVVTFKAISSAGNLNFVVKNLGRGAAVDIVIIFSLKEKPALLENHFIELVESHQDRTVVTGITRSHEFNNMNLDQIYEHYGKKQTTIIARINYKDILSKDYTKAYSFDITALQKVERK